MKLHNAIILCAVAGCSLSAGTYKQKAAAAYLEFYQQHAPKEIIDYVNQAQEDDLIFALAAKHGHYHVLSYFFFDKKISALAVLNAGEMYNSGESVNWAFEHIYGDINYEYLGRMCFILRWSPMRWNKTLGELFLACSPCWLDSELPPILQIYAHGICNGHWSFTRAIEEHIYFMNKNSLRYQSQPPYTV